MNAERSVNVVVYLSALRRKERSVARGVAQVIFPMAIIIEYDRSGQLGALVITSRDLSRSE